MDFRNGHAEFEFLDEEGNEVAIKAVKVEGDWAFFAVEKDGGGNVKKLTPVTSNPELVARGEEMLRAGSDPFDKTAEVVELIGHILEKEIIRKSPRE